MSNDPFDNYAQAMQEVKATDRLIGTVLEQAEDERHEAGAGAPARAQAVHRRATRPHAKRPAALKFAAAACLAMLAAIVGVSLAWPGSGGSLPAGISPTAFAVKAYGAVDDTLLPTGSNGMVYFNCETETQRMIPVYPDEYANEGFYTGCVFSVEGENIARVQANVSRGELYRVTSKVWSIESDPQFAQEVSGWKQYKIGQGELLGKYDYVAPVLFYGALDENGENAGKDRVDPSRTGKVNLYHRLGATVDTAAVDEPEESAGAYRFGLWTNEPFPLTEPDSPDFDYDANLNAALDTLDGAQLTITVTFDDGTCATQVVELHAADFKANVKTVANGMNTVLELVPQIVDVPEKSREEIESDMRQGIASIHTLYGIVTSETDEPFPCGEASHPFLVEPLTNPRDLGRYVDATAEPAAEQGAPRETTFWDNMPPGPAIAAGDVTDLPATYAHRGHTVTYERIDRLDGLPEGVGLKDLNAYYQAGGLFDPSLDHIENYRGCSIDAEGNLASGYSYVLLTETVTNTLDEENDVFIAGGSFTLLGDEADGMHSATRTYAGEPAWRSGHEGAAWDSHYYFQKLQPGETREFSLLYILPDELLARPDLAFTYYGHGGMSDDENAKAFRLGTLA